jgi:CrcB protein
MREALLLALGGSLGSVLRYVMTSAVTTLFPLLRFPLGTLLVNSIGSIAIGLVMAYLKESPLDTPEIKLFLVTGFLGGFTTFSALSYETVMLYREGAWLYALAYVVVSILFGISGVAFGISLGTR